MQTHHYAHATTPAGPGTDTVISNAVQIDPSFAFAAGAATGEVSIAQIYVDDPNLAYDFKGLWRWYVIETDCAAGDHYAWNGYIGVQEVSRGEGSGSLFPTGRRWSLQLSELNKIADLRVISGSDGDRPDETIAARITWLIGTVYLPVTDNGLITASTLALDKNDYRGQRASDVLNDCALKAQFNWWIYYDQSAAAGDEVSLAFFDPNDTTMYRSDLTISNVAADINGTTCFAASDDSKVSRDPQKIAAGVYLPYTGGAVYDYDYDTSYEFMFQDQVAPTATIKTSAKASVLATQFLEANDEQDEQITTTIQLPSSLLNIVKHGQLVGIKLSHVPGYEDFRNCRVTRKTFGYTDARSQKWYDVPLELSPVPGEPSGAASAGLVGVNYSGTPELPRPTTPGNVLLAIMFASGNTTRFPTAFRALDNPPVSPAAAATLPFSALQTAAWTVIGKATTDYKGQNIGGPCSAGYGGPYHGAAGTCLSGLMVAAAWRYVAPGEVTTKPAQFSTEILDSQTLTYLWELPTTHPPTGTYVEADGDGGGNPSTATLPTISGNSIAAIQWATAAGHTACPTPTASALLGAGTTLRGPVVTVPGAHAPTNMNDTTTGASNTFQWGWLINMPTGGIASARITGANSGTPYAHINWCGIAIQLPSGITLPDIPYPSMQSA